MGFLKKQFFQCIAMGLANRCLQISVFLGMREASDFAISFSNRITSAAPELRQVASGQSPHARQAFTPCAGISA